MKALEVTLWLWVALTMRCWADAGAAAVSAAKLAVAGPSTYSGTIELSVDARDLDHRVFQVHERLSVQPGSLTLIYPQWLPGNHAPTGPIEQLAGLVIWGRSGAAGSDAATAGQRLEWQRDPVNVYSFHLVVPPGVDQLELAFQFVSPISAEQGRRVMTPELLELQWEKTLLYPAGFAARSIQIQASVALPSGWPYASALELQQRDGDTLRFKATSVEMLVDSPLFAGRYARRIVLDGSAKSPVYLNIFADRAAELDAKPEQIEAHRRLVRESTALFGPRHFAHYDFLLALSDSASGVGLEHHQSSENGLAADYFSDWDNAAPMHYLLAHEMTHSWNGKFRRPADLATTDYSQPMQNSLLWVYEGMTEFWGVVLAARSGLWSEAYTRDAIAWTAATYGATRPGRTWRSLQDTTNQPIMAYRKATAYPSWQRGTDYYQEGLLLWLDADMQLRELTRDRRSLGDFVKEFIGMQDAELGPQTYTYDDILHVLQGIAPNDWNRFLRAHLDDHDNAQPLNGLAGAGWQLVYDETPTAYVRGLDKSRKQLSLGFSLGLSVLRDAARISDVIWDSPAWRAGLAPGMSLIAVGGLAYTEELLKEAVSAAKTAAEPIELLIRDGERYRSVKLDYHQGLRYPRLVRIAGRPDRLAALLKPVT